MSLDPDRQEPRRGAAPQPLEPLHDHLDPGPRRGLIAGLGRLARAGLPSQDVLGVRLFGQAEPRPCGRRLSSEPGHPVDNHRHRPRRFCVIDNQEALAVGGGGVVHPDQSGVSDAGLEQGGRRAGLEHLTPADRRRHQLSVEGDKKQLPAVSPPRWLPAARDGDSRLALLALPTAGARLHVHLPVARLRGEVGDPPAVRRQPALALVELGVDERYGLAISLQRQGQNVPPGLPRVAVVEQPAPITGPVACDV